VRLSTPPPSRLRLEPARRDLAAALGTVAGRHDLSNHDLAGLLAEQQLVAVARLQKTSARRGH